MKRGTVGTLLFLWAVPAAAATDAEICRAAKLRLAGKYDFCRLKAEAKAVRTGNPANHAACDGKLALSWESAETRGACPTNGDQAAIHDQLAEHCDSLALRLGGAGFADNGDGTVTDTATGLMWEKKDDLGGIHDVDNLYSWSATGSVPDGTAFTAFLGTLNGNLSYDGSTVSGCFANHCDWRLPSIAELETILLEPFPCRTSPCADPALGPTQPGSYWSGTTNGSGPNGGWYVYFVDGTRVLGPKLNALFVRAVRGGQ
jgi:hypothetical protein